MPLPPPTSDWLPNAWLPEAQMTRIHLHWTAGAHRANAVDRRAYHLLVQGDGTLVRGTAPISANDPARRLPGQPRAAHTLNANTHAIGVALCAMRGAREHPFTPGPDPVTPDQWDAAIALIARLATRYAITPTPQTVLTHAEVATNLGIPQRAKWDITRLPFDAELRGAAAIGAKLRREVLAAMALRA